jgi:endogenous inhibitor of DNA gyrase (YacG/DUF329 family)
MSLKSASCPICGQPAQAATRPFCGPACRDRDLLQWLGEGYRVPDTSIPEGLQKNDGEGLDSQAD